MRHRRHGFKLNTHAAHRSALLKNLVRQLFLHESITTTVSKAKFFQPEVDRLIGRAMDDSLSARKHIAQLVGNEAAYKKLFRDIAGRYTKRSSGFTTRKLLGKRRGDSSLMVKVELMKADVVQTTIDAKEVVSAEAIQVEKKGPVTEKSETKVKSAVVKKAVASKKKSSVAKKNTDKK